LMQLISQRWPDTIVIASHQCTEPGIGEFEQVDSVLRQAFLAGRIALSDNPCPQDNLPTPTTAQNPGLAKVTEALSVIAQMMQDQMIAGAASAIVRESGDCAAALCSSDGDLYAQSTSLPVLQGSLAFAAKQLAGHTKLQAGDLWLWNDPRQGGTHLPDLILATAIALDNGHQIVALTILHHDDVGGNQAGSVPTDATSLFAEGLVLPITNVGSLSQGIKPAWQSLLAANSRKPTSLLANLEAQRSALRLAQDALRQWSADYPSGQQAMIDAIAANAQACSDWLKSLPDANGEALDWLDGDGITDEAVQVHVRLVKQGDQLTIDLTGCADQCAGPINASPGALAAAIHAFTRIAWGSRLPYRSNAGDGQAVQLLTRPDSIVQPGPMAALNARTNLLKRVVGVLMEAWHAIDPSQQCAAHAGVAVVLALSGNRGDGSHWQFTEIIGAGAGAYPGAHGASAVSTDIGNARNTSVRTIQAIAPLQVQRVGLVAGSGGAGRWRGGNGIERRYLLLEGHGAISYRGERHSSVAHGREGGLAGACSSATLVRASGQHEVLRSKSFATWHAGDTLVIQTAGGGGWGAPAL
jgi:N-methylhydantoinase B